MINRNHLHTLLEGLCASQKFAVLATQSNEQPYCNLIAFSVSDDLRQLFFVTSRKTSKYGNLKNNSRVSLLFDSRSNTAEDIEMAIVATAIGNAAEVTPELEESLRAHHIEKHPSLEQFVRSPECAMFRVDVQKYIIVNMFENVSVLEME